MFECPAVYAGAATRADINTYGTGDLYHSGFVYHADLEFNQRYVGDLRQRNWAGCGFWLKAGNATGGDYISWHGKGPGWHCAGSRDSERSRFAGVSANRQPDNNYSRAVIDPNIFGAGGKLGKH